MRLAPTVVLGFLGAAACATAACYWVTPYEDLTSQLGAAITDAATSDEAAPVPPPPDAGDPDLVARWSFDEDGGTAARDETGHGNDLFVSGGAVLGGTGRSGGGLQYPGGAGQAIAPSLSGTGFPAAGTLSFWALCDIPTTDRGRKLFDGYDESRHHLFLSYSSGNGDAAVQALDFAVQSGTGFELFASPRPVIHPGRWVHFVIVWDTTNPASNDARLYIDGVVPPAGKRSYPADGGRFDEHFNVYDGYGGTVDDMALWSRAFTDAEVNALEPR
ncbi:MAG: lacZ 3 [Labilithrix sp.]|nr:lacZ 3 [Labilithrix sp.]